MGGDEERGRIPRLLAVVAAGLVIGGVVAVVRNRKSTQEPGVATQHIAVPAYIQTAKAADWERLLAQDSATLQIIVVNVADGPGTVADAAWQDIITRANHAGKRVLGYVDSGYFGSDDEYNQHKNLFRPATEWRDETRRGIDAWYRLYTGIGGIFIDNGTWSCGPTVDGAETNLYADLYKELSVHAKGPADQMTILNPGVNPKECMRDAADKLVSWEGTASQYLGTPGPGEAAHEFFEVFWNPRPSPDRFWHIVYDVSPTQVSAVLDLSRQRGAGWVFLTDDKGDWKKNENPFDDVPRQEYWDDVLSGVANPITP